jgi:cell division protein FtsA
LQGLEPLAAQIFGLPVHIGHSLTVGGPTSAIESPEYSTAIGLVRYALGSQRDQHQPPSPLRKMGQSFQHLIQKVRAFM